MILTMRNPRTCVVNVEMHGMIIQHSILLQGKLDILFTVPKGGSEKGDPTNKSFKQLPDNHSTVTQQLTITIGRGRGPLLRGPLCISMCLSLCDPCIPMLCHSDSEGPC